MGARAVSASLIAALLMAAAGPCALAGGAPSAAATYDAEVCRAMESAIGQLQSAQHHRVVSIVMDKLSESTAAPQHESAWAARIQYYLDYVKAEDDPYLQGMLRCFSEMEDRAPKSWLEWARGEIERRRSQLLDQIAFRQELSQQILVRAELDQSGNLVPGSVAVFFVLGSGVTPVAECIRACPTDEELKAAGYDYLKSRSELAQGSAVSGQTSESSLESSSSAVPTTQAESTAKGRGAAVVAPAQRNANRVVILAGTSVLLFLAALMALNQYFLHKTSRR